MKPVERLRRIRATLTAALDECDFEDATAAVEYAEEHLADAIAALTEPVQNETEEV